MHLVGKVLSWLSYNNEHWRCVQHVQRLKKRSLSLEKRTQLYGSAADRKQLQGSHETVGLRQDKQLKFEQLFSTGWFRGSIVIFKSRHPPSAIR